MKSCQKFINVSISGGGAINEIVLLWVILYPDHLLWDYPLKKQAYWEVVLCCRELCGAINCRNSLLIASGCWSERKTLITNPNEDQGKALEWCAAPYPGTRTLCPQWAAQRVPKSSWVLVLLKRALGCLNRLDLVLLTHAWVKTEMSKQTCEIHSGLLQDIRIDIKINHGEAVCLSAQQATSPLIAQGCCCDYPVLYILSSTELF